MNEDKKAIGETNKKGAQLLERLFLNLVAVGGLEPPRPKATDFEVVDY